MILSASWVDRVSAHLRALISCVSLSSPLAMSIATFPQPSGYLSSLLLAALSYNTGMHRMQGVRLTGLLTGLHLIAFCVLKQSDVIFWDSHEVALRFFSYSHHTENDTQLRSLSSHLLVAAVCLSAAGPWVRYTILHLASHFLFHHDDLHDACPSVRTLHSHVCMHRIACFRCVACLLARMHAFFNRTDAHAHAHTCTHTYTWAHTCMHTYKHRHKHMYARPI